MTPVQAMLIRRFIYLSDKVLARAVSEVGPQHNPRRIRTWRQAQGLNKTGRGLSISMGAA